MSTHDDNTCETVDESTDETADETADMRSARVQATRRGVIRGGNWVEVSGGHRGETR